MRVLQVERFKGFSALKEFEVRPWKQLAPHVATMSNVYRPRTPDDEEKIPHSFLFRRRDCPLKAMMAYF